MEEREGISNNYSASVASWLEGVIPGYKKYTEWALTEVHESDFLRVIEGIEGLVVNKDYDPKIEGSLRFLGFKNKKEDGEESVRVIRLRTASWGEGPDGRIFIKTKPVGWVFNREKGEITGLRIKRSLYSEAEKVGDWESLPDPLKLINNALSKHLKIKLSEVIETPNPFFLGKILFRGKMEKYVVSSRKELEKEQKEQEEDILYKLRQVQKELGRYRRAIGKK